ncbi:MAG: hypothetical protein OEU90_08250 [Gammaproteobacteria bacterium]|nr:hypothetical protein [Gammaproteobacteria bacterium]MDH3749710.1 hypothetical protein [Gammaproteobacteria bacterium]MDH3805448.1 hypothetical protein [Gammaproteobacteria bacterium]
MLRYNSRRHKQLMDLSELALQDAAGSSLPRDSRIATTILHDNQQHSQWESRHARLLLPVAQQSRKKRQIVALRNAKVQLVHRRAFFKYLRAHEVRGEQRRRLFRLFHTTLDYNDAILAEHRHYMLAVSSRISTDHIIDVMDDMNSSLLLRHYEKTFARYFEMKCYVACARDSDCSQLVHQSMRELQAQLLRIRRSIESVPPSGDSGNFDRQELLARSGRYEALNYLNA